MVGFTPEFDWEDLFTDSQITTIHIIPYVVRFEMAEDAAMCWEANFSLVENGTRTEMSHPHNEAEARHIQSTLNSIQNRRIDKCVLDSESKMIWDFGDGTSMEFICDNMNAENGQIWDLRGLDKPYIEPLYVI